MRAAAFLALAALPAAAQEVDCANADVMLDLAHCEARALEAADAELNAAYADLLAAARRSDAEGVARPPVPSEQMFREAQHAWIAFRDAACAAESNLFYGGTGASLASLECLRRLTERRAADLRLHAGPAG